MGCFSGRLMSAASDQKLFCKLCSPFCCSFDEFVEEKVISPSYSSAILTPPPISSSLKPYELQPTRLFCPWDFPAKNTGMGCHVLLQGIFLTQGLNPHFLRLLHCRWILYRWVTREALQRCVDMGSNIHSHCFLYLQEEEFAVQMMRWLFKAVTTADSLGTFLCRAACLSSCVWWGYRSWFLRPARDAEHQPHPSGWSQQWASHPHQASEGALVGGRHTFPLGLLHWHNVSLVLAGGYKLFTLESKEQVVIV